MMMEGSRTRSNFVRNSEGSSSVRLRRRKDALPPNNNDEAITGNTKKRNRHSGDFCYWTSAASQAHQEDLRLRQQQYRQSLGDWDHHKNHRYSMEVSGNSNKTLLLPPLNDDRPSMETLDRKIPNGANQQPAGWSSRPAPSQHEVIFRRRHPTLARPPPPGSSSEKNYRRISCDISSHNEKQDNSEPKISLRPQQQKETRMQPKKYHHKRTSRSDLYLHHGSHYLENQSVVSAISSSSVMLAANNNDKLETRSDYALLDTEAGETEAEMLEPDKVSVIHKGLLWQQRDKVFSRWKERYFVLTSDYLQCFKKASPSVMHSAASEMGRFVFKLRLAAEISSVELLDKRGYLTVCLHLTKEGGRILLRKPEGIREWHNALKECVTQCKERRGLMKSTKEFWSKKQFDSASAVNLSSTSNIGDHHWLISRHRRPGGGHLVMNHHNTTAVDYGFIDAPKPRSNCQTNNERHKTSNNNTSAGSTVGQQQQQPNGSALAVKRVAPSSTTGRSVVLPTTSMLKAKKPPTLLTREEEDEQEVSFTVGSNSSTTGSHAKDSDSKSHDSGIDSIEKPGRSPISSTDSNSRRAAAQDEQQNHHPANNCLATIVMAAATNGELQNSSNIKNNNLKNASDVITDKFTQLWQMRERSPSDLATVHKRLPQSTTLSRPKSAIIMKPQQQNMVSSWHMTENIKANNDTNNAMLVIQRPQITKL